MGRTTLNIIFNVFQHSKSYPKCCKIYKISDKNQTLYMCACAVVFIFIRIWNNIFHQTAQLIRNWYFKIYFHVYKYFFLNSQHVMTMSRYVAKSIMWNIYPIPFIAIIWHLKISYFNGSRSKRSTLEYGHDSNLAYNRLIYI